MSDTITLVRLRLQEGKTSAEWLRVNEKINEWVTRQPGCRMDNHVLLGQSGRGHCC
jgi:hypothetical protein